MKKNKTNVEQLKKDYAKSLLRILSAVAEKNATVLCRSFIYEPTVPKKLRK